MRMKKLFILFVLLNYLLCLFSQNKFAGVNLSLTSKVCTQSFSENQITYLNIGLSSSTHLLCGLGANLFTLRADTIKGISIAGIGHLNHYEGYYNGLCIAGMINMATEGMNGIQISGIVNSTDEMNGLQVSGIVGISGYLKGVQIAPFNICGDCKGVQIGLVNCWLGKEVNIFQLGLINLNRSTKIQPMIFGGNSSLMNVSVRFRGKLFYNMVGVGAYSFHLNDKFSWNLSYRSGLWLPITKFLDISGDVGYQHLMTGKNRNESLPGSLYALQARLNLECKIRSKLSLFLSGGYEVIRHYGRNKTHSHQPIIEGGIILF